MSTKTCNDCHEPRPLAEFPRHRGQCRSCLNAAMRKWRQRSGRTIAPKRAMGTRARGDGRLRCECGQPKNAGDVACTPCMAADGDGLGGSAAALISALRVLGGSATIDTLCDELAPLCVRTVLRALKELRAQGRVESVIVAEPTHPYQTGGWRASKTKEPATATVAIHTLREHRRAA